jgi:S-adenosylmethionine synthetase
MHLYLGDRATKIDGVDMDELAVEAARGWFRENLRYVDPEKHLDVLSVLRPGSAELTHVFADPSRIGANDTSVGVGFAPLTETERLVLETERILNGPDPKKRRAWVGEDVKVLGVRRGRKLELTVAAPLVDRHVGSEAHYFELKEALHAELVEEVQRRLRSLEQVTVVLDALDQPGEGLDGVYLTVTGTSAESADSGEVGRGNRANGLITFHRPMTLEAAAGKNPASHVGKVYGVFAYQLAAEIHTQVPGVRGAVVWLWSRIGEPVSEPAGASIEVLPETGMHLGDLEQRVREVVRSGLDRLPAFCQELARGEHPTY